MHLLLLFATFSLYAEQWVMETLYPDWAQAFATSEVVFKEKSDYWDLVVFENKIFGRTLSIDGTIQITEKDEALYSEMMAHVPLFAHGNAQSVLIIGGGDGAVLREVLRHEEVKKVTLVELDPRIIELSKRYFPTFSNGAFEDPRVHVVIQDAALYIKETAEFFDVILCDSPDPIGPGLVLYSSAFYGGCKARLNANGIFVNQNGVPFLQKEELALTIRNRKPHFKHVTFYVVPVPTYVGGFMALGWASDHKYRTSQKTLAQRMKKMQGKMTYYTPAIHRASFTLPQYMLDQ